MNDLIWWSVIISPDISAVTNFEMRSLCGLARRSAMCGVR